MDVLKLRKDLKKKKPTFSRQDSHKKIKLDSRWRRPRGWQSKVRLKKRGYRRSVEVGWGSPRAAKHLTDDGLEKVIVHNTSQLDNIDAKKQAIFISSKVGKAKKLKILKEALKKNIKILNYKEPETAKNNIEKVFNDKKKSAEDKKKERTMKDEKRKKEAEKKKKEKAEKEKAEEKTEEEKKLEEKKEQDKLLTTTR